MKNLFKFISVVALVITIFLYMQINKPYTEAIDINWAIKLSDLYKEIYSIDSGASVHGDGERYHIFQYINENDINQSVNWESNKDKSIEAEVNKVLSQLNVPKEDMPDFQSDYKYYVKKKDHNSSNLYLIFMTDTKKLFVIEDIL